MTLKTINIMTSCDENLMKFIPVQLESISDNLADRQINFYLFHDGKNIEYVNKLHQIKYENIHFNDVIVSNLSIYDDIAKRGGIWCGAAYYSLCAHEYLPDDMDRVYYIDAGDILIIGNIDEYYFDDFEGKSIIATCTSFKVIDGNITTFTRDDISIHPFLETISRGIFNSGSYVMNLNKMRRNHYTVSDFLRLSKLVCKTRGKTDNAFFGDQGLLSLTYVGDIKYYGYPKIKNPTYMPYDFGIWYFDKVEKLDYEVKVIHYIGDNAFKPWYGKYSKILPYFQDVSKVRKFDKLNKSQIAYYKIWYKYAVKANDRLKRCKINDL